MPTEEKKYPFLFSAIPHGFTDSWMGLLSPEATLVMLAFYRETVGWDRTEAAVSFPTLQAYTGIASYTTISNAIQELINAGLIQIKEGERTIRNGVIYQLGPHAFSFTPDVKVRLSKDGVTFTPDVKLPLHHMEKYPYKPRKSGFTPHVKRKPPQKHRQPKPKAVSENSERGAKERLKEPLQRNKKEQQSSPTAQTGAPNVAPADVEIKNQEEEKTTTRDDASPSPSSPARHTMAVEPPAPRSAEMPPRRPVDLEATERQKAEAAQAHAERLAKREALKAAYAEKSQEQDQRTQQELAIKRALKKAAPGSEEALELQRQRQAAWDAIIAGQQELAEIERAYRELEG